MKETIDVTIRRWLRKWLGIDENVTEIHGLIKAWKNQMIAEDKKLEQSLEILRAACAALEQNHAARMTDLENTRADLIKRMEDLALDIAERKREPDDAKAEAQTVVPAHVPWSVRRKQAEGGKRNMAAYMTPGKKPSS